MGSVKTLRWGDVQCWNIISRKPWHCIVKSIILSPCPGNHYYLFVNLGSILCCWLAYFTQGSFPHASMLYILKFLFKAKECFVVYIIFSYSSIDEYLGIYFWSIKILKKHRFNKYKYYFWFIPGNTQSISSLVLEDCS